MLTTFIVNSIGDDASGATDGLVTLREAIIASETNTAFGDAAAGEVDSDTIRFSSELLDQTIVLSEGEFAITDDLRILGGSTNITIDANSLSRAFDINSDESVVVRDLSITAGQSVEIGGAIAIDGEGRVVLNSVSISSSSSAIGGGGVAVAGSNVLILRSDLSDNSTDGSGGGLLVQDGRVRILDSTIVGNNAGTGGGIFIDGNSESTARNNIIDSIIAENSSTSQAGGIFNGGDQVLGVLNSEIIGNTAEPADSDTPAGGGGILNEGTTRLIDSSVSGNSTLSAAGANGGGILSTSGLVILTDSEVSGNTANTRGGGIDSSDSRLVLINSVVGGIDNGNTSFNGGGIAVTNSETVLRESVVSGNLARGDAGGGIHSTNGLLRIADSEISDNRLESFFGSEDGGAGFFFAGGLLRLIRSDIENNSATNANGGGGALIQENSSANDVIFFDSAFNGNLSEGNGGGLKSENSDVTLVRVDFEDNRAEVTADELGGNGGGLYFSGSENAEANLVIFGASFSHNTAQGGGGLATQFASVRLRRLDPTDPVASFVDNRAGVNGGGAIFSETSRFGFSGSGNAHFIENSTSGAGGAVLLRDSVSRWRNPVFESNSAQLNGGAINSVGGSLELRGGIVSNNFAGNSIVSADGGGIYFVAVSDGESSPSLTLTEAYILDNGATGSGGGVWADNDTITGDSALNQPFRITDDSIIAGNDARENGGGIFSAGGLTVLDSTIDRNSVGLGNGGGLFAGEDSATVIRFSSVNSNAAALNGGGFYNLGEALVTMTSFVSNRVFSARPDTDVAGGLFTGEFAESAVINSTIAFNTPTDRN